MCVCVWVCVCGGVGVCVGMWVWVGVRNVKEREKKIIVLWRMERKVTEKEIKERE